MRHQKAGLHLSRTPAHRKALFSNLVSALFTYERIRTTDVKAKETRRLAERTITWARRLGEILTKKPERRSQEERARVVHAVRMARRVVRDRNALMKLFNEIGPRYLDRAGGYTRIVKLGQRPGDAAPISLLELIPGDDVASKESGETKAKGKGAAAKDESKGSESTKKTAKSESKPKAKAAASAKDEGGAGAKKTSAKPAAKKKTTKE